MTSWVDGGGTDGRDGRPHGLKPWPHKRGPLGLTVEPDVSPHLPVNPGVDETRTAERKN